MIPWRERQRIRENTAFVSSISPKEPWRISYSSATATLALVISALSAYYNLFYTERSLSLALTPEPPKAYIESAPSGTAAAALDSSAFSYFPVLSNTGNHTECVLSVWIFSQLKDPQQAELGPPPDPADIIKGDVSGPFILKAGEAVVASANISLEELLKHRSDGSGFLFLAVNALLPSGSIAHREFVLGKFSLSVSIPSKSFISWTRSQSYAGPLFSIF